MTYRSNDRIRETFEQRAARLSAMTIEAQRAVRLFDRGGIPIQGPGGKFEGSEPTGVSVKSYDDSRTAMGKVRKSSQAYKMLSTPSQPLPKVSSAMKTKVEGMIERAREKMGQFPASGDEHERFRWESTDDRLRAIQEYLDGKIIQGFFDGDYGNVITSGHRGVYIKTGDVPVGSGKWMGWPEKEWGVSSKEWRSMTTRERASLEVREQNDKWVRSEYEDEKSVYKGRASNEALTRGGTPIQDEHGKFAGSEATGKAIRELIGREKGVYVVKGGEKAAAAFVRNWSKLPEDVKAIYRSEEMTRSITFKDKSDHLSKTGGEVAGVVRESHTDVEFYSAVANPHAVGRAITNFAREAMVHEAGHIASWRVVGEGSEGHDAQLLQHEFTDRMWNTSGDHYMWRAEKGLPPSSYARVNPREDFAESWTFMHLAPNGLRRASVDRYKFMDYVNHQVQAQLTGERACTSSLSRLSSRER